jgi:alpha-L-arabinofuranosidase
MTSYIRSPNPSLHVFPTHRLNAVDRKLYSGFTEHMGRCIYGGIYDPDNSNKDLIDIDTGFRLDVIEALKPLNIPVFRYPGGNFCATYHWEDGVGPRESRVARPELAWGAVETNHFGTDEFMAWCKRLNAEPYLCLNFGTGNLDEAMNWLDYCNGTRDTYYANLRRKNGHEEPYDVKYWALGNEMWGEWQINQMTAEAYAEQAYQWAKALKLIDPSIQLVLCGREGSNNWDHRVLTHLLRPRGIDELGEFRVNLIDMHSIHIYTRGKDHYENAMAPLHAERTIQIASALIDLSHYENKVPPTQKRPKICFDEWNVWTPSQAPGSLGAEQHYNLSDALAVGVWLNVFIRQSKDLEMCNIAQSVNVLSPLMTTKDGVIKQTIWYPYELFCKFMKGSLVQVHVGCEYYEGSTTPDWLRSVRETPYIDISATIDDDGWVSLCVVNTHLEKAWETEISGTKGQVEVHEVSGNDAKATNMNGSEEVGIRESKWDGSGKFKFPKHSLTMLRWDTGSKPEGMVVDQRNSKVNDKDPTIGVHTQHY